MSQCELSVVFSLSVCDVKTLQILIDIISHISQLVTPDMTAQGTGGVWVSGCLGGVFSMSGGVSEGGAK